MYKGTEKCAGCGKSGADKPRKVGKELCSDCKEALRIGVRSMELNAKTAIDTEFIFLGFRHVDYYLHSLRKGWDDEIMTKINEFAFLFLKSVEVHQRPERAPYITAKGVDATSCAWFKGYIRKAHWEILSGFLEEINRLFSDRVIQVKSELESVRETALNQGQNFLIRQIKSDIIGESQQY